MMGNFLNSNSSCWAASDKENWQYSDFLTNISKFLKLFLQIYFYEHNFIEFLHPKPCSMKSSHFWKEILHQQL